MVPLLTLLVNHFLAGSIPAAIRGVVLGATLLAFQKPGGGIRPIAIGETLRRLTSKLAARCMSDVAKSLTPQLGVGVPGGVEVAVHATRAHALEHPDHVILRVDFRNAFNSVDRAAVFEATLEHAPALYHWVASCYSGPTTLFTWARPIPSSQGVPQGDPLSPLLFCLVLHALTERITECKPSLQWWFLDDGVIAGPPEVIARVVQTIRVVAPGLGLHLSMAKSDLRLSPSTVLPPSLSGFSRGPLHAFITLGAPIGPPDYCTEVISAKVDKSRRLLTALGKCPDPQIGLSLLRHCGSFCRMAFFTRTVSPSHCSVPFQVFDSLVMATLSALIGSALPPDAQLLASLPLKKGGMGLLSSSRLHALGYASSIASSRKAFHALYTKAGSTPPSMVAPLAQARLALVSALPAGATHPFPDPFRQDSLSGYLHDESLDSVISRGDTRRRVLLQSTGSRYASTFLSNPPYPFYHISPRHFICLLRLRLDLPIYPAPSDCLYCADRADMCGDHSLKCKSGGDRIQRHNCLRDALVPFLRRAGFSVKLEACLPTEDHRRNPPRPGDVLVYKWDNDGDRYLDVAVTHFHHHGMSLTAHDDGGHLVASETRKTRRYRPLFERSAPNLAPNTSYAPLVLDTAGAWGPEARSMLDHIAERIGRREERSTGSARHEMIRSLSVTVAREVGSTLLRRLRQPTPVMC